MIPTRGEQVAITCLLLSVKQIALALGFRNPYHFSKLFKQKTGLAPRDYRQHWLQASARGIERD